MRRLDVALDFGDQHSRKLGVLVADGRDTYFAFDDAFETKPLPVSPIARPAKGELWHHPDAAFAHLPGLLFDAMPDGWGRLLQDRAFGRLDVPREKITPLDRLAAVGNAGLGALVFTPPIALVPKDEPLIWTKDLAAIAGHADDLYVGSAKKVLPALLAGGGSPGGARPKVLAAVKFDSRRNAEIIAGPAPLGVGMPEYSDDYFPWIIKFPTKEDGRDAGVVEAAYAEVARASGLLLPETHLFEANNGLRYFGAARFDRLGNGGRARLHVHTMAGLLQADYRMPSCDYRDLLQLTLRLTGDMSEVQEAFRRLAFNVLAGNRDDHARNFAFLMDPTGTWRISPAYDLTFSPGINGEHTTAIAGEGRSPSLAHISKVAQAVDLDGRRWKPIVEQVEAGIADWPRIAAQFDVPKSEISRLGSRLKEIKGEFRS